MKLKVQELLNGNSLEQSMPQLSWRRRRRRGRDSVLAAAGGDLSCGLRHLSGDDDAAAGGPSTPWSPLPAPVPAEPPRARTAPACPTACRVPSKGTVSLQIEPQISILITAVAFFCTSKAIKRATGCIHTETLICGCSGPSSFLFVGSS